MAEIRHLENRQLATSQRKIIDEIWYTTAHLELDDTHMTKYEHLKKSRWRTAAILKIGFSLK